MNQLTICCSSAIEYAVLKMVEKGEKLDYWKFKKWRVEE